MKYSNLYTKTNKNMKAIGSINAELLIKAGFIRQELSGVYTFLPLGLRVLQKIEQIVREEMDTIGAEVFMPTLAPVENWKTTGRFESVDVLLKAVPANSNAEKKHMAEYVVSPTHEEIVTPLAKYFAKSYKDLPSAYYQIQTKFRNEPRAKSGLLRGREFRMKDLYSFHVDNADFEKYYEKAKIVYMNVFRRLGLGDDTVITLASGGDFTDKFSHEFQTILTTGEDTLFFDAESGIYYNREIAPSKAPNVSYKEEPKNREDVLGKGIIGVEELSKFLHISVEKTTKTLLYEIENGDIVAVAVRGGYQINEYKLKRVLKTKSLHLASFEKVKAVTGAEVGYAGVLNLPKNVRVLFDDSCKDRVNFETGANKTDYHTVNVNFGRDLPFPEQFYDVKEARVGDMNPTTECIYKTLHGSEVGNIFPLETKFSSAFDFTYTDEKGTQQPVIMGCYGIGTSRLMGVIVEKFHDDKGLIWPKSVAPYEVHLVSLPGGEEKSKEVYETLQKSGIDVFWDDRDGASAGEKFADADLFGMPYRLVVSKKTGDNVEVKKRNENTSTIVKITEILKVLQ
jgi:prolyl-tRNA synthetase